ncbi:MAG: histidine kinase [Bacteroidales bacterium]|nr:histidine kinase [Bacteroidales bacterium]
MKFFLVLIFVLFSFFGLNAQEPILRNFSISDGLPSSEIYHVFQDSKGFIWVSTSEGACRFNGYQFEVYDISAGLPENTILEVYEDYKGRIWFITLSSEFAYLENGRISLYKNNNTTRDLFSGAFHPVKNTFSVKNDESIEFVTQNYIKTTVYINGEYNQIKFTDPQVLPNLLTEKDYYSGYKYMSEEYIFNKPIPKTVRFPFLPVFSSNNTMLSWGTFLFLPSETNNIEIREFDEHINYSAIIDEKIFVCPAKQGVYMLSKENGNYKEDISFLNGLSISYLIKDSDGGYWFSTLQDGLYYAPNINVLFFNNGEDRLFTSIARHRETIWFSDYNGNIYKKTKNGFFEFKNPYPKRQVSKILANNKNDTLFLAGYGMPLTKIAGNKIIYDQNYNPAPGHVLSVNDFIIDNNNNYCLAQSTSLLVLNKSLKPVYDSRISTNARKRFDAVCLSNKNEILAGAMDGLYILSYYSNLEYLGNLNPLLKSRISSIKKFEDGFAIGTKGAGLIIYLPDTIINISKEQGLLSNSIKKVYVEDRNIWLATNKGLTCVKINSIKPFSYLIRWFGNSKGLPSGEINDVLVCCDTVYLTSNKGFSFFNYKDVEPNQEPTRLYFSEIFIAGKPVNISNKYELDFNNNSIDVKFIGLNFRCMGNILYKYKMQGVDKEWNFTTNPLIRYTNLPIGENILQIMVQNEDGYWSKTPESIVFYVKTPFYKTTVFFVISFIIVLLFLIGILSIIYKSRLRRENEKSQLTNELNKYRQQALAHQMNPHFIFNALNSIQYFIYKNDKENANNYLAKFSQLLRLVIENSQKQNIPLKSELQAVELYLELESLRFRSDFDFHIHIDKEIETETKYIPTLLIQPFVENAIWKGLLHKESGQKSLFIRVFKRGIQVICEIEDNGVGRLKAKAISEKRSKYSSTGSKLTKTRLNMINNLYGSEINLKYIDLKDNNDQALGTKVILFLPLQLGETNE